MKATRLDGSTYERDFSKPGAPIISDSRNPTSAANAHTKTEGMTRREALIMWEKLKGDADFVGKFLAGDTDAQLVKEEIDRAIAGPEPSAHAQHDPGYRANGQAPHDRSPEELKLDRWSQP